MVGDEAVELAEPRGVAVDSKGAVLVADTRADRIDKLAPDGELVAAWSAPTGGFSGWAGSSKPARRDFSGRSRSP